MKLRNILVIASFAVVGCVSVRDLQTTTSTARLSKADSLKQDREVHVNQVMASIKGTEQKPVEEVFGNLTELGGFPAENLVVAMNKWAEGLGVSCGHCHNTKSFASDEKNAKDVARQMIRMNNRINDELLKTVTGLKSASPRVNCITCHRGTLKPSLRL